MSTYTNMEIIIYNTEITEIQLKLTVRH